MDGYDWLKEDVESHHRYLRDITSGHREVDDGKYHWCPGCKEQVANCRCEAIRVSEERIAAWSRFQQAVWASEGVEAARKEVADMGFAESEIEGSIDRIAVYKLYEESDKRTKWLQSG